MNTPEVKKKVIKHASEIYPYGSAWFHAGVHSYFMDGEQPQRPCSDDYIMGYQTAQISKLKDRFEFKPI